MKVLIGNNITISLSKKEAERLSGYLDICCESKQDFLPEVSPTNYFSQREWKKVRKIFITFLRKLPTGF